MRNDKFVSSESSLLLYEQVMLGIKDMIANGDIKPGQKLPNEQELCTIFDTSRITIRRALKELEDEGVIEILHGKGTFVKNIKHSLHILNLKGFTEGLSTQEKNNFSKKIVSNKLITADRQLMEVFKRDKEFEVVELVRIVEDDNGVFSLDYAYLPNDIYNGISEKLKDNISTFQLIHNDYGIEFKRVQKNIEIIMPTPELCNLIGITRIDPLVQVTKIIHGENDEPVHFSKYYLLANRVNFYIDISVD
ncbi:GntR family transcriptional regulator [Bacillus timonensis]|uniref:GntR family transcriptional regulator n=1 Tax=Bacillus timonensis TaxID=1033734 RepID=UPI000287C96A|nr:GntR family transcriptional regulator [Bacillus timonensis]